MRKMMLPVLAAVLIAAGVASANGPGSGSVSFGAKIRVFWGGGGGQGPGQQLGPWYQYWPLEAHFQTPALPEYPYWPAGQSLPPGMPFMGAPSYGGPAPAPYAAPGGRPYVMPPAR